VCPWRKRLDFDSRKDPTHGWCCPLLLYLCVVLLQTPQRVCSSSLIALKAAWQRMTP
jgi:hypothetical protein